VPQGVEEAMTGRVKRDPEFAKALLREVASLLVNGQTELARLVLQDLIAGTRGDTTAPDPKSPLSLAKAAAQHLSSPVNSLLHWG